MSLSVTLMMAHFVGNLCWVFQNLKYLQYDRKEIKEVQEKNDYVKSKGLSSSGVHNDKILKASVLIISLFVLYMCIYLVAPTSCVRQPSDV